MYRAVWRTPMVGSQSLRGLIATAYIDATHIKAHRSLANHLPRRDGTCREAQRSCSDTPPAAVATTTIHGGAFQTMSRMKAVSASAKSYAFKTALVQTGL